MAGGGGHEPNLTPFIDLFSVLICFLLMSTAWINLEVLPSNIEKATSSDSPPPQGAPPPPDEKKVSLSIDMKVSETALNEDGKVLQLSNLASGLDVQAIGKVLEQWKERHPQKNDVVLNTEAAVKYGEMIKLYDLLIKKNFPEVGINPQ